MKQTDTQNKRFSKKTVILIILCVLLVATVTVIGANWDLVSLSGKPTAAESGSEQHTDYTWEAFSALSSEEKDAFAESFGSQEAFWQWVDSVTPGGSQQEGTPDNDDVVTLPWENGGKQPNEYTYSEFLALSIEQQSAFANTFKNADAFTAWQRNAIENDNALELSWKNGDKDPSEYTWDDFLALSATEKDLFYLAFPTTEEYTQWLDRVNP